MTVHGRCLCGDVVFEADAPFEFMGHCHCSMCRKHHGAAKGNGDPRGKGRARAASIGRSSID